MESRVGGKGEGGSVGEHSSKFKASRAPRNYGPARSHGHARHADPL